MDTHALTTALSQVESTIKSRYAGCLKHYARRFDVDDLYQITCMKAHQSRKSIRAESPTQLRSWILSIARTSLISAIQAEQCQKRDMRLDQSSDALIEAKTEPMPIETSEDAQVLDRYLASAQSSQGERALRLRYLEGLSYDEIAEELSLSNNAVRSLVSRALKAIRQTVMESKDEC